jgi:hypothetical protein
MMRKGHTTFLVSVVGFAFLYSCSFTPTETLKEEKATMVPSATTTQGVESLPTITPSPTSGLEPSLEPTLRPLTQVIYDTEYPQYPPLRPREDTWLKIFGTQDPMVGTSIVQLPDNGFAVALGFVRGLKNDFGLIRYGPDGFQAKRYSSDRQHLGFFTITTLVKAINLEGDQLSLALDDVWLPVVGTEDEIEGWQVRLDRPNPYYLTLTDLIKVGEVYYLSAALGDFPDTHLVILKVNTAGNILAAVEYPQVHVCNKGTFDASGTQIQDMGKLFFTADGYLVTGGYLHDSNELETGVVLWLDQNGVLINSVTVTVDQFSRAQGSGIINSNGYQGLEQLPNGDLLFIQDMYIRNSPEGGRSGAFITRLSSNGGLIWNVGFAGMDSSTDSTFIRDIQQAGDQLILVGGSTDFAPVYTFNNQSNLLMASLTQAGELNWLRSLESVNTTLLGEYNSHEFANEFLITGDGRMVVTGGTTAFREKGLDAPQGSYYLDALVGMVDLQNGGINGASHVMHSPDINSHSFVWVEPVAANLGNCTICAGQTIDNISLQRITYLGEDLTLEERDLYSTQPGEGDLTFRLSDSGRELVSSRTFLIDPQSELDLDHDGLDQAWENAALEVVKPILEIDENESWLENLDAHDVALFTRVHPYPTWENPEYILFRYAVTWSMDYGAIISQDPRIVQKEHRGDIEQIILAWRVKNERSLELEWVYTSAHDVNEHRGVWHAQDATCNRGLIADTGYLSLADPKAVGSELMCESIQFKENRVWLQVSLDKHALYPSAHICEDHAHLSAWSGGLVSWVETCGWDAPGDPVGFGNDPRSLGHGLFLFDAFNIGEPTWQLIDDLYSSGNWRGLTDAQKSTLINMFIFENERIYAGNINQHDSFCGGIPPEPQNCAGTVGYTLDDQLPDKLVPKLGPTTYRVIVYTKRGVGAGTDSKVDITLYGANGEKFTTQLDGSFESSNVDIFHIGNPLPGNYFTEIAEIGLSIDDTITFPNMCVEGVAIDFLDVGCLDQTPDWNVLKVEVLNKITGQKWLFSIDEVISVHEEHRYRPDVNE